MIRTGRTARAKAETAALAAYAGPEAIMEEERGASCAEELDLREREDEFSADELAQLERDELELLDELFGPGFVPGPPDGA